MEKIRIDFETTISEQEVKENIEKEIDNYVLPAGLSKDKAIELATKDSIYRGIINDVFEYAYVNFGGFKKVEDLQNRQTYYIKSPNYKDGNPLEVTLVRRTSLNQIKSMFVPVELIVWCYKQIHNEEIQKGFIDKSVNKWADAIRTMGNQQLVSYIEEENKYTNIKVNGMGDCISIDVTGKFITLYTISLGEFAVFFTALYNGSTHSFEMIDSIVLTHELVKELAGIYEYYLSIRDEAQEQQDEVTDEVLELQIAQLKSQISLLESQLSKNRNKE